jgi:hypothetical protein
VFRQDRDREVIEKRPDNGNASMVPITTSTNAIASMTTMAFSVAMASHSFIGLLVVRSTLLARIARSVHIFTMHDSDDLVKESR